MTAIQPYSNPNPKVVVNVDSAISTRLGVMIALTVTVTTPFFEPEPELGVRKLKLRFACRVGLRVRNETRVSV